MVGEKENQMKEIKFLAYYQKVTDDSWVIEGEYTMKDLTDRGIKFDQERIVWMQYTGLKDKNGVEIYEGDKLKCNDLVSTMEWHWYKWVGKFEDGSMIEGSSMELGEVIGNIFNET